MNYCETCVFWKKEQERLGSTHEACLHSKLCEAYDAEAFAADALTYSYQEGGCFYPGPKFGCVHHKERI